MKLNSFILGCLGSFLVGMAVVSTVYRFHNVEAKKPDGRGTAAEWNSLSAQERSVYVEGYIGGYRVGSLDACDITDKIFDTQRNPIVLQDGTLNNSVMICNASIDQFTRMGERGPVRANYEIYSDVITTFYKHYSNYRNVPFPFLMKRMLDKTNLRTAEQLFQSFNRHEVQATF